VPADFANRLPAVLAAMARAGLVAALEAAPGDPLGDLYLLGDALFSLCRARSFAAVQFGVLLQSAGAPGQTETLRLAGWRTAGGIVAADLSALSEGRAEVLLLGPSGFSDLVRTALHADVAATAGPFAPSPDYTRAALLESLKPRPPLGPAPATTQTLAIPGRPALRLVREGSQDGALLKDGTTVGRDEACDLVIAESSTSRKHARIEATPQGWQVRDLGSSNGTWRNGVRIVDVAPIQPADALVFGKTRFRVEPA